LTYRVGRTDAATALDRWRANRYPIISRLFNQFDCW
jgi:hypothetical protein